MIPWSELTPLIIAVLTGGFGVKLIDMFVRKRFHNAEARDMEITGELRVVGATFELYDRMRSDYEEVRNRVDALNERVAQLETENRQYKAMLLEYERQFGSLGGLHGGPQPDPDG